MLTAGDVYAGYLNMTTDEHEDRDELGRSMDILIMSFARLRKWARNTLWASVMLILVACAVQAVDVNGYTAWTVMLALILLMGIAAVPLTVMSFRSAYRPLLAAYRQGRGLPSGIGSGVSRWSTEHKRQSRTV